VFLRNWGGSLTEPLRYQGLQAGVVASLRGTVDRIQRRRGRYGRDIVAGLQWSPLRRWGVQSTDSRRRKHC